MAEVAVELQQRSASGLPTPVPAPPPNPKNLPRFHHNAITRCMCRQCKRAFEYVWACLGIARAKLQVISTATRRKYTLSTWLAISISVIVGSLGLRYAYVQIVLSNESLKLAQWTARKDFWEICSVQKVCRQSLIGYGPWETERTQINQPAPTVSKRYKCITYRLLPTCLGPRGIPLQKTGPAIFQLGSPY